MAKIFYITLNNKRTKCSEGETILEVAKRNKISIPTLCHHLDFSAKGNCRICVVEVKEKGSKKKIGDLVTSCSTEARPGMIIKTNSEKVKKSRNLNIELIFSEHVEKCESCVWSLNCSLRKMARDYDVKITRFKERKENRKIYKFANAVEIDGTQCIDCRNCIEACSVMQNINYLEIKGKGYKQEIVPTTNKDFDCIYCGQCALHCPVSAAQEQSEWEEVEKKIRNKKKILVAQFAPSIRVSVGEEFGLPYGKIVTDQIVSGLKALGFDYVFDVNFGADLTTMVEAEELLERIKYKKTIPMITSCCPAWVKYTEFYHPELIPNLTTSRSPHIHLGGVIKTYWARKMKINPKNIEVVSIMPCTAKKYEAKRKEMKVGGNYPVDNVLTTREFAWLMKKNKIKFGKLKNEKSDNPLGEYTGAGAIYGGSGGVMESALRTAHYMACGNKKSGVCRSKIDFKEVRGMDGVKEAVVKVAGSPLRVAVVNGIGNIEPIIENLSNYDYIEVMACPGGCIGGGGQPIPTTKEIREKRIQALYKIDKGKKIRKAHENKGVLEVLDWLEEKKGLEHKVLHTYYYSKRLKRGK
ncbi:[FeFe] hydrogenase, group A [bacterium]|nr:[FeFe] hydrogenase, group A [bacterium]